MNAMPMRARGFVPILLLLWTLECIAAYLYSQQKDIPAWAALAAVPAFLLETAFYLAAGVRQVRELFDEVGPARLASVMTLTAPLPYLIYSVPTGVFDIRSAAAITSLAAVASFWFVFAGKRTAADLLYLPFMAAPILLKWFPELYPDPVSGMQMRVLGALMWYRTGLLALLSIRRVEGVNFGFVPRRLDWSVGLRHFLYFLPVGLLLGFAMDYFTVRSLTWVTPALFLGTFVVTLCVLATVEEFFFRGMLQQALVRMSGEWVGLIAASVIFGLCHLWYSEFPNWRFVALATVAGVFYGRAFQQARSIRAPMVTHALVVTVWKVLLTAR
jgi:membrane protease YdiL (CAAX protease family)